MKVFYQNIHQLGRCRWSSLGRPGLTAWPDQHGWRWHLEGIDAELSPPLTQSARCPSSIHGTFDLFILIFFFRIYRVQKIHIHWNRGDTCILAEKFIVYILYKSCKMCAWKQRQCIYSWSQSLTRYWTHCHTAIIMIEMTRMNKLSPPTPPPSFRKKSQHLTRRDIYYIPFYWLWER